MNKIEEIANQAEFSVGQIQAEVLCPEHDGEDLFIIMDTFNKLPRDVRWHIQDVLEAKQKRFAKLIIEECINIISPDSYHRAFPDNHIASFDGIDLLEAKIGLLKKHFGVE